MLAGLKQQWQAFRRARPGNRFEGRYERHQKVRNSHPWWMRVLKPLVALVLVVVGVVLCVIPGPGVPLIIVGAGLLGDEWRPLARALDWLEVRLRKIVAWGRRWWKRAPMVARGAVVLVALLAMSSLAYGGYQFFLASL
jgi:hypothetical protein